MAEKTIFAKIIDREIPADIVYEDDRSLAFRDINPAAPTHILIIPKKNIAKVSDMEQTDEALIGHLFWVAKKISQDLKIENSRLVINNGAGAGQSVFHVHLHLLAGRSFAWPPG